VITFNDPDGLELELVAHKSSKERDQRMERRSHSCRTCHKRILLRNLIRAMVRTSTSVLTDELGFVPTRKDGSRFRYEIPGGGSAS
jgi:glyoxalase family protein